MLVEKVLDLLTHKLQVFNLVECMSQGKKTMKKQKHLHRKAVAQVDLLKATLVFYMSAQGCVLQEVPLVSVLSCILSHVSCLALESSKMVFVFLCICHTIWRCSTYHFFYAYLPSL